jgi:phage shock protein PspC (stress-responsive transcriptional regulator)
MNEITKIHLARTAYEIDVAAKRELEKYLTAIRKSLGSEIEAMEDIEIRMTEILAERGVVKDSVITENDVKNIIGQLGKPQDFSSDDKTAKDSGNSEPSFTKNSDGTTKKFYRDTDNAVLGGVCAGLAAYTGWDVTIIRILAVIFTVIPSFGSLILIYIVIWFCAPAAGSVSEKLEMRGEPVDLESIKKTASKLGREAKSKSQAAASRVSAEVKKKTPIVARILAVFFGLIGLLVSLSIIIALSVFGSQVFWVLHRAALPYEAPLTVALALAIAFIALIALILLILSVGGLVGTISKGLRYGLVTLSIIATLLLVGSVAVAGSWFTLTERSGDGIHYTIERLKKEVPFDEFDGSWCLGICLK